MPRGHVQKRKLTAAELVAGSATTLKKPGFAGWIETHPDKEAIITALRMGAKPVGVARMLTDAGPVPVSVNMVQRVLTKIREGAL